MPKLDEREIHARIADQTIVGLTLDTSVFHKYGYNLDYSVFTSLRQFKGGSVHVLLSEIVVGEMTNHIASLAEETRNKLKAALRDHRVRWKTAIDTKQILVASTGNMEPIDLAKFQVANFIQEIGVQTIPASGTIDVAGSVIERYFSVRPPFEKNESKKNEFPDAFALLSLEAVFKVKQKMLLCVSGDKGWHLFAEKSDWLVCVDSLDTALSFFNIAGLHVVDQAIRVLKAGEAPNLTSELELAIQARLDDTDFSPECSAPLEYEAEPSSAVLHVMEYDTISNLKIIESDNHRVAFTFDVEVLIAFEAEFNFHVYDSVDKDYVNLANEFGEVESRKTLKLVVSIDRNLEPEPEAIKVEAFLPRHYEVDFGYIEPFPNEDPEHEKY
jgi:PIN domain